MPIVETSITINAGPQKVWPLICNMTDYPNFMPDVLSVEILEQSEAQTITAWKTNVDGRKINWTERDCFFPEDLRIEYEQLSGDLKKFTGHWQLQADENGNTKVDLLVDFEFGIPMIAGLLNPLLKKKVRDNSMAMLQAIKGRMESK